MSAPSKNLQMAPRWPRSLIDDVTCVTCQQAQSPTFPTPQRTAWSVEDRPATGAGCYPDPRISVDPQNTVFWRGGENRRPVTPRRPPSGGEGRPASPLTPRRLPSGGEGRPASPLTPRRPPSGGEGRPASQVTPRRPPSGGEGRQTAEGCVG